MKWKKYCYHIEKLVRWTSDTQSFWIRNMILWAGDQPVAKHQPLQHNPEQPRRTPRAVYHMSSVLFSIQRTDFLLWLNNTVDFLQFHKMLILDTPMHLRKWSSSGYGATAIKYWVTLRGGFETLCRKPTESWSKRRTVRTFAEAVSRK
jgi:hypothetical protein